MKKIAIFNHKGGVSKTTTTYNLGHTLARCGKRILLVDMDSQCNLTLYAMGYDKFEKYCEEGNPNNVYDCLSPAYTSQPKMIEAADCYMIDDNLYLLPGNLNFTENEVQLGISMQLSSSLASMKNLPGALNYLVEETARKYKIDIVLFDMNPSLSSINQDTLISSDYFVVPTTPDFFSIMSIRSLAKILPTWEKWATEARKSFSKATYQIPAETPKFLGYTVNDFNLSSGKPQKTFKRFIDKISQVVAKEFVPALEQHGMMLERQKYEEAYECFRGEFGKEKIDYGDNYCLAQFSNFNKSIAISNEKSIPIIDLNANSVVQSQSKSQNWFRRLYFALAKRIIMLIDE